MTSRELASLILLGALAVFGLWNPDTRNTIPGVVKAFFVPKILAMVVAFVVYMAAVVWGTSHVGLWNRGLLKETIIWGLVTGFVLLFNTHKVRSVTFFRDTTAQAVGLSAFIEFFLNTESFNLLVELVLQVVLILVAGMLAVTSDEAKHRQLRRLLEGLLTVVGVGLVIATAWKLGQDWSTIDRGLLWRSLLLAVWLTIAALPFIYGLSLVMGYELLFSRMDLRHKPRRLSVKLRAAAIAGLGGRLRHVHGFAGTWPRRLGRETSFGRARSVVGEFKSSLVATADGDGAT